MKRPLLFLLADKDLQEACRGCFLERKDWARSFGCRHVAIEDKDLVVPAGQKDPGLFSHAAALARPFLRTHRHLVVLLDSAWDGSRGAQQIEKRITRELVKNGRGQHNVAGIAIKPEPEAWLWSDRNAIFQALSNELDPNRRVSLRSLLQAAEGKEEQVRDPKDELDKLRERLRIPASSAQFQRFAKVARIERCGDPAFARLRESLRRWFPPGISNGNCPRRRDR